MSGNDSDTVLLLTCDTTSFIDSSEGGSTHVVTKVGGATSIAGGEFDNCLDVQGSSDYLTIPDSSDFQLGTDGCIDFWIKPDTIAGTVRYGLFNQERSSTEDDRITVLIYGDNFATAANRERIRFILSVGGAALISLFPATVMQSGVWQHIAIIKSGSDWYMYIDGVYQVTDNDATAYPDMANPFEIGRGLSIYNDFDGKFDEFRIKNGDDAINNPDDPLYISGGDPTDGFTPPTEPYSVFTLDGHSWEPALLEDDLLDGHSWEPTKLLNEKQGHSWEEALLDHEKQGHSWEIIKLLEEKQGHSWQETLLIAEKQGHSWEPALLRADGVQAYFFDLRDSDDIQVGTATGSPPTLVFTDLFTGLSDGDYTLYARSDQKFKNLEDIVDETFVRFTLVSGLIVLPFPNEVLSLIPDTQAAGAVELTWSYNSANESVAPDTFEIYVNAVFNQSVTYTGAEDYSVTIPALPETLDTPFNVTAKAATQETAGLTVTATPDSTAPASVPFQFEAN